MTTRTRSGPSRDLLGRFLRALTKGSGIRLSAEDVQVLRPMVMEAVRRRRVAEPVSARKGRPTLH